MLYFIFLWEEKVILVIWQCRFFNSSLINDQYSGGEQLEVALVFI